MIINKDFESYVYKKIMTGIRFDFGNKKFISIPHSLTARTRSEIDDEAKHYQLLPGEITYIIQKIGSTPSFGSQVLSDAQTRKELQSDPQKYQNLIEIIKTVNTTNLQNCAAIPQIETEAKSKKISVDFLNCILNAKLEHRLNDFLKSESDSERVVNTNTDKKSKSIEDFKSQISNLQNQILDLQKRNSYLSSQVEQSRSSEGANNGLVKENERLKEKYDLIEKKYVQSQDDKKLITKERDALKLDFENALHNIDKLENSNTNLEEKIRALNKKKGIKLSGLDIAIVLVIIVILSVATLLVLRSMGKI